MRECIFFLCLWCGIIGGAEAVSPGIQHFDRYRSLLEGKKVGIVANQTAVLETGDGYKPVSYTHLTLPTICSV